MSESGDRSVTAAIVDAETRTRSGPSIVWLVPLITLLVGGWLIVRTLSDQGPVAQISFRTAEGIEVGKTRVKYKSVDIGVVDSVRFHEDFRSVLLGVQFNPGTEDFLRRNTRFWVVRPQFSARGVSGLDTLISGSYIEIDPGPGAPQRNFIGLEQQPLVTADDAGTRITLVTRDLGSIDTGSPIYYQGLRAGEVLGHELGSDARSVFVHAFVRDPFDQLVRGNTRFWNVSGMDVTLDANGLNVRTASLQALMFGGIAFDTPDTREQIPADVTSLIYTLHDDYASIEAQSYTRKLIFVMYFESSVRGLNPGAPVEFKGIRIGQVTDVRLEFDSADDSFRIPVLVEIEPERIVDRSSESGIPAEQTLHTLVTRGLRGRLQTGSLLTGQLYVELSMYPDAPLELRAEADSAYPELPTIAGSFEAMTATIENFVGRLEDIEIDRMGEELLGILEGTNTLLNTPENAETVTDLQASLRALKGVLRQLDEGDLDEAIRSANVVLGNLDRTLALFNEVLEPEAPLHYSVTRMTGELEETARAIRGLVELLDRRPQSLLFGRDTETDVRAP